MKTLFVIIFCFAAFNSFSQTNEVMVEEKASEWIKVTATPVVAKSKTTTVKKKTTSNKPVTPKQDVQEEFEKTNNQVNRFKKAKKG